MSKFEQVVVLLFAAVLACFMPNKSNAQNADSIKVNQKIRILNRDTSAATPLWIRMMDRLNPNYVVALKSFNDYWKGKEKPTEEDEIFNNAQHPEEAVKNSSFGKTAKKKRKKDEDEDEDHEAKSAAIKYSFEYKKFMVWQQQVLPYVQEDGSILSAENRLKIYNQQKQQIQAQKENNSNTIH